MSCVKNSSKVQQFQSNPLVFFCVVKMMVDPLFQCDAVHVIKIIDQINIIENTTEYSQI